MLKILLGTDWVANRNEIFRMLTEDVKARKGGRVLLVPELISHDSERRLAQWAGDTSSRFAEVLSFTRLVGRVADHAGLPVPPCLDNGGRLVAMAASARQLTNQLKAYAAVESKPEFLSSLVDAVDEFKRCCISSTDLKTAAAKTEGVFAQKLEELAMLLETYDAVTSRVKCDPRDQISWLLEQMEACDYAEKHSFYIDGFPDFTRQNMAVLEQLVLNAPEVTIALTCDVPGSDKLAYDKAGDTALELIRIAKRHNVPCELISVPEREHALNYVRRNLFQGELQERKDLCDYLMLYRADSVYEECRNAAQRVLELVRNGCRYRDIGVVCSDLGAYEHALRIVFSKSDIPVYRSGTDEVLQKTVVRSLLAALNAAVNGFAQEDVLQYLKSVLSPLEQEVCDLVENYCILWGINGSRWYTPWVNHPEGLGGERTEQSDALLDKLNAARSLAIDPLYHLQQNLKSSVKLSEQVEALFLYMEEVGLSDRLSHLAEEMDASGDHRSAQILNQLWDILLNALEQLKDVLADTVWDTDSFIRLFVLLLSQYHVGTIPTVLDSVMVGPVSAMRCHQVKHLIVLGVKEGAMPSYGGTTGVFTDREREQLRKLDVPLTGGGMEGLQSEFADIYGVFSSADDTVMVSYEGDQPSFIYARLLSMTGKKEQVKIRDGLLMSDRRNAAAYLTYHAAETEAFLLGLQDEFLKLRSQTQFRIGKISDPGVKKLYGKTLHLSASQIDVQANCRFQYFMKYGLHAKEMKEATVDPTEFGTYFHAVLENTAKKVMERGGFHKVSLEETLDLAKEFSSQYISERFSALESSRLAYLNKRNLTELLCLVRELWEELSYSLFEPDQFEVRFGYDAAMPPVRISGRDMDALLMGAVDRVDKWNDGYNNYFRVIDYKSGQKSFDYCDVYNGLGLQMLLYMYTLEQEGDKVLGKHPIPVGVQYFSARFLHLQTDYLLDDSSALELRGKELVRKGLILSDEAVLKAMEPDGAPHRIAAEYNKKGELKGDIADRDQFKMLKTYVFKVVGELIDQISSGDVSPNPYTRGDKHNACWYCPYGAICHKHTVEGRRDYQAVKAARFWEDVEKEVGEDG